jgi:hypothetical protein
MSGDERDEGDLHLESNKIERTDFSESWMNEMKWFELVRVNDFIFSHRKCSLREYGIHAQPGVS